ncbi:hypothetical protein BDA96_06G209300 [Sorghum bicolor]|uniref:FYVE-type domain-containing protein n=2 Tax=Sorghum bicolor TaxID=4558 RepID=A0A1B6PMV0_SORBI|nr:uncharacterized protein LOC8057696 isoform X1 [Sorghum bicolor]KAG0527165.1 hypothetical protein BDA96_06G209300 [Sorghum bicolor]KXG26989.1 hypothetical protein SORBI_3006G191900 [Sorghum bicolor]|eukprot:XP_021318894.1 uncharacterized protein LOC8057696 isoform X1 [Sorghum bicolor]
MAGSFDGRTPTRGVEQAIVALKKGAHILKCGKRGKPKFCAFRLSSDETTLIWYSKGREKHLSLSSVSAVVLGQKTIKFLRQRCPEKESHSFSLIYKNGERSLDLICSDRDQAEYWYLGLRALLPTPCSPCSSIGSRSSRQMDSCTNTPSSYVQLKSRLPSAHGTPRHIQVYSSHRNPKKATFFGGSADCSEALFYPRQRTFSDIDTYLGKLTRKMSNPEIHGLQDIMVGNREKEEKITQTPKLKTFEGPRAACRLDSLKDVFFWGDAFGSILDYDDTSKSLPMLVDSTNMLDVQSIACGETHAAIITKQGEVYSWGNESSGGIGNQVNIKVSRPKLVESVASLHVKAVAYGSKHACAVTVSGELFEWGEGPHMGQLDCYANNLWFPHKLFSPLDGISVVKIACGPWHTAIITSSGQLYTYGDGTFGVLGHGDTQGTTRPKEVEYLKGSRVKCVACGPWHTAAIVEVLSDFKSNSPRSKLFTWGDADRGKLGHADKKMKLIPTCVDSLTDYDFIQVSCGMALTVVLSITGVVFTIGSSMHGQLGNPHADGRTVCAVEGLLKTEFVRHISSGSSHVAVLTTNGKVFTWGKGKEGQLGLGDYLNRSTPTLVDALEGRQVESISCGYNYTAAVCLHKIISRKDLSVCSGCKMAFGFTRKKHNCYHCGSMFCNSCSSNKVARAALAPDKIRRYRVCDGCFSQLLRVVDSAKVKSELKISKGAEIIRSYTPKLSRIFRDANLPVEKVALVQRPNQRNEVPATPVQAKSQRWGQVECPAQFLPGEDSFRYQSISKNHMCSASVSERMHDLTVLKSGRSLQQPNDDQRKDLNTTETLLTEEVKQLRSQVTLLVEQYHQKALQVELYKQKLDETWLIVRDEAAKCKAAKDIIKVLTDQCKALSEKLLVGQQYEYLETKSNISQGQTLSADLQHYPCEKLARGKLGQLNNTKNHETSTEGDEEYTPSSSDVQVEGSRSHLNGSRTFDGNACVTQGNSLVARVTSNGVIEQIERGVYVTFAVSPSGKKDIKRVRFSRKHFGEKEAQHWWEENKGSVYAKYSTEKVRHQLEVTIQSVQE